MNPNPHPPQSPEPTGTPPGAPRVEAGQPPAQPYGYPQAQAYPAYPAAPGQAPHAPGYPAAPWQYAQQPPRFNGAPLFLRIMMFIGAAVGILMSIPMIIVALNVAPVAFLVVAVFGLYGVGSLVLAILAKRRSPAIRWSILAFHILAMVLLVLSYAGGTDPDVADQTGSAGNIRFLATMFTIACIVLISIRDSSRYYTKPSEQLATPAPHMQQQYAPGGNFPGYAQQPPAPGQTPAAQPAPDGYGQRQ